MCYECMAGRNYDVLLCVSCRKVWKDFYSTKDYLRPCPTCGQDGRKMGPKWRAPRLTNESAWRKIEQGDYLWDRRAVSRKGTKLRLWVDTRKRRV